MVVNGEDQILSFVDASSTFHDKHILMYDNQKHNRGAIILSADYCYYDFYSSAGALIERSVIANRSYNFAASNTFASQITGNFDANALDGVVDTVIPTQTDPILTGTIYSGGPAFGYVSFKFNDTHYYIMVFSYASPSIVLGIRNDDTKIYKLIAS